MNSNEEFQNEVRSNVKKLSNDQDLIKDSLSWMLKAGTVGNYSYNFSWLGRPIIQFPQDILAMQELFWQVKPDLVIETGIAHGGSLIFSASMLALLDICDSIEAKTSFHADDSKRKVVGVDIDIRAHNRDAIESHPMYSRIEMIEGSSIDPVVVAKVQKIAEGYDRVLVCLDSMHTYDHVLKELLSYAPLVSVGSYCVVFDTIIDNMPNDLFSGKSWCVGNSPKTAVVEYLRNHPEFEIDKSIQNKLLITVAPDGYLKRIK